MDILKVAIGAALFPVVLVVFAGCLLGPMGFVIYSARDLLMTSSTAQAWEPLIWLGCASFVFFWTALFFQTAVKIMDSF